MAVNLYEAMFVVDSAKGGSEFPGTVRMVVGLLTRHGAEIQRVEKWSERKLTFPMRGSKRGIYILIYFNAEGEAIQEIRTDIGLNEQILRILILRPFAMSPVVGELYSPEGDLLAKEPAAPVAAAQPAAAPAAEQPAAKADETA